jgi:hypothetical protein
MFRDRIPQSVPWLRIWLDVTGLESKQEEGDIFFDKISKPGVWSTMYVQCQLIIFSGDMAAGALCLPIQSVVEGKNSQIYYPAIRIGLDGLDRDNWVKCSSNIFWVMPEKQPLIMNSVSEIHRCLDYQRSHRGRYEWCLRECDTM